MIKLDSDVFVSFSSRALKNKVLTLSKTEYFWETLDIIMEERPDLQQEDHTWEIPARIILAYHREFDIDVTYL